MEENSLVAVPAMKYAFKQASQVILKIDIIQLVTLYL